MFMLKPPYHFRTVQVGNQLNDCCKPIAHRHPFAARRPRADSYPPIARRAPSSGATTDIKPGARMEGRLPPIALASRKHVDHQGLLQSLQQCKDRRPCR
jgi:hypothetical protein